MRKSIIFAAITAIASLASCQKENAVEEPQPEELVFTATIENAGTKTTVNADKSDSENGGKIYWVEKDEITVTDKNSKTATYVAQSGGSTTTTFKIKSGQTALGEGPYTATYGTAPSTSQSHTDYYSAEKVAKNLYMTAPSTATRNFTFTAGCGLLKLNLSSTDSSDKTISEIKVFGKVESSDVIYTLTCSTAQSVSEAKDFFIALPAGDYTVFKFTNSTGHICYKTAKKAISIANNSIQPVTLTGIVFNDVLPGKFSISGTKKVKFSKGNLYCKRSNKDSNDWTWRFYANQYQYDSQMNGAASRTVYAADIEIDHFCWGSVSTNPINNTDYTTSTSDIQGTAADWGKALESSLPSVTGGWMTLTQSEWIYLLNTTNATSGARTGNRFAKANVNKTKGLIIFPDGYTTVPSVTGIATVNTKNVTYPDISMGAETWAVMESDGCVFLPAAGLRTYYPEEGNTAEHTQMENVGSYACYWTSTPYDNDRAHTLFVYNSAVDLGGYKGRGNGCSVRLVSVVQ